MRRRARTATSRNGATRLVPALLRPARRTPTPEKIEAAFKNGILTVTLPKRPEAQAKQRKIEVKAA